MTVKMQLPMKAQPTTGLADEVLKDAPSGYHEVLYEFLSAAGVERLIRCTASPYVWDVEIFAHYFAAEIPESDVVATVPFNETYLTTRYVGKYLIVNPPEVGTYVAIIQTVHYMTTDAFFAWLGNIKHDFAQKTREVLAWLIMYGARKADNIQIEKLEKRVKDLERKVCERDGVIESLQKNLTDVLRTFLRRKP